MDLKQFYLKQKEAVHQGTLSVYSKIPLDLLDWRPTESALTLGQLVRHVWMWEQGIRRIAVDNDWSYFEKRVPQLLSDLLGEVKSLGAELGEIVRAHTETLRAVEAFPLQRWEEIRENAQFQEKRPVREWLDGITEHHIHHRAQVEVYTQILTGERASSDAQ
jgi:uncharacterized damage-inducible protein DinB